MPKSTNDSDEKKVTKRTKKEDKVIEEAPKKTTKKTSTSSKKSTSTTSSKKSASSKTTTTKKEKTTKKSATSKAKTTNSATKKTSSTSKTRTRKSSKKENVLTSLEYYDLPYRYNQTIVKILAQTPNTLFVYWDISDEDRKNLEETYGDDFFYNTKPVLIVHNETKNYSFEIDINDFANSWYLNISDTDCKYNIELGRRFLSFNNTSNENVINTYKNNNYIYISSSNKLITPNDHVLLNFNNNSVQFKNIKTNTYFSKEIKNMQFIKNYNLYKELYSDEILNNLPFNNPSSNFKKM